MSQKPEHYFTRRTIIAIRNKRRDTAYAFNKSIKKPGDEIATPLDQRETAESMILGFTSRRDISESTIKELEEISIDFKNIEGTRNARKFIQIYRATRQYIRRHTASQEEFAQKVIGDYKTLTPQTFINP